MGEPTRVVLAALAGSGLLLQQDKRLPNVVTLVTGESLRASWWSHPKARLIFAVLSELSEHPDVLFTKLLYGKVTLVHRKLWPAFLAVASAHEPWQFHGLSTSGRRLFSKVSESKTPVNCSGKAAKELELRMLVRTVEVHTESGRHEMEAESWGAWTRRVGTAAMPSTALSCKQLEVAATAIGATVSALPWSATRLGRF